MRQYKYKEHPVRLLYDKDVHTRFNASKQSVGNTFEVENFGFTINPASQYNYLEMSPTDCEKALALMHWYFKGNNNDISILKHFPEYEAGRSLHGKRLNSNYGEYVFAQGTLDACLDILASDNLSRHASISINNNDVMFGNHKDKLCTNNIMFRVRDGRLNMTVQMRSNDLLRNMPFDTFAFSMFYGILFNRLSKYTEDLHVGHYYHNAASMHIHKSDESLLFKRMMLEQYICKPHGFLPFDFYTDNFEEQLKQFIDNEDIKD